MKARRVWDESYVAAVSRVSHVCSSESTFSIIPTLAPHTECHVGMKNIADSISQTLLGRNYGSDNSVRKMTLLSSAVADGSRNMVDCLRDKKKSTNTKIGAIVIVGGAAAIFAAAFFGPASLAAWPIYSWVTAAGASGSALAVGGSAGAAVSTGAAVTLGVKLPLEGSRFEKGKHRSDFTLILSLNVSIIQFSKRDRIL